MNGAGNINDIKHLTKRVRRSSENPDVLALCDAAEALRAEVECYRARESAVRAKSRDAHFWQWARNEGLAGDWEPETNQPALF